MKLNEAIKKAWAERNAYVIRIIANKLRFEYGFTYRDSVLIFRQHANNFSLAKFDSLLRESEES